MNGKGIVRGIVTEIRNDGTAMVSVVLQEEVPRGLDRFVQIRCDHHRNPVYCSSKYGVEFAEKSKPRAPKLYEGILLRRNEQMPGLAGAWCYENDPLVNIVMSVRKPVKAPKTKKQRKESHYLLHLQGSFQGEKPTEAVAV